MPITVVTTLKIDRDRGLQLAQQVAPILKRCGASAVRCGYCHTGARPGTISVVSMYPDWQAFGRAAQAMFDDREYLAIVSEVKNTGGEILDRAVLVMQDL